MNFIVVQWIWLAFNSSFGKLLLQRFLIIMSQQSFNWVQICDHAGLLWRQFLNLVRWQNICSELLELPPQWQVIAWKSKRTAFMLRCSRRYSLPLRWGLFQNDNSSWEQNIASRQGQVFTSSFGVASVLKSLLVITDNMTICFNSTY